MGDLTTILGGSVEEVKTALAGKSHVDLHALRKAEVAGKNRAGVLSAIDAALAAQADNGVRPAETIDTAGAPQQIVPDVDMAHAAVDADPRANTTAEQNRIDFNDPTIEGHEAVERNLKDQASA